MYSKKDFEQLAKLAEKNPNKFVEEGIPAETHNRQTRYIQFKKHKQSLNYLLNNFEKISSAKELGITHSDAKVEYMLKVPKWASEDALEKMKKAFEEQLHITVKYRRIRWRVRIMEEIQRWLMFSYWGSYLKDDYMQVGLDVTEILMKHWGMARLLEGVAFNYDEGMEDIDSIDKVRDEVLSDRDRYELYDVTFFNPTVTEEIYVNRLYVNDGMLRVEEYDDLKYFQTDDPAVNERRTQSLLEVFTEVASLPAIQELWMVNHDRTAFMGHPAYLYRHPSAV